MRVYESVAPGFHPLVGVHAGPFEIVRFAILDLLRTCLPLLLRLPLSLVSCSLAAFCLWPRPSCGSDAVKAVAPGLGPLPAINCLIASSKSLSAGQLGRERRC